MPRKIADHTIGVVRGGKSITVPPGKMFEFTDDEIADIERYQPDSLRDPINEDPMQLALTGQQEKEPPKETAAQKKAREAAEAAAAAETERVALLEASKGPADEEESI